MTSSIIEPQATSHDIPEQQVLRFSDSPDQKSTAVMLGTLGEGGNPIAVITLTVKKDGTSNIAVLPKAPEVPLLEQRLEGTPVSFGKNFGTFSYPGADGWVSSNRELWDAYRGQMRNHRLMCLNGKPARTEEETGLVLETLAQTPLDGGGKRIEDESAKLLPRQVYNFLKDELSRLTAEAKAEQAAIGETQELITLARAVDNTSTSWEGRTNARDTRKLPPM